MALIYLGIGSNINREQNIEAALDALTEALGTLQISNVYESESVGFVGDDFYNLAIGVSANISLGDLNTLIKRIEDENGRVRSGPKFGPRTLDIDVLTYDDLVGVHEGITLPRSEITKNAYVLLPMVELAARDSYPGSEITYEQLWADYDKSAQSLRKVSFIWNDSKTP